VLIATGLAYVRVERLINQRGWPVFLIWINSVTAGRSWALIFLLMGFSYRVGTCQHFPFALWFWFCWRVVYALGTAQLR
jgi:hypothetical protein